VIALCLEEQGLPAEPLEFIGVQRVRVQRTRVRGGRGPGPLNSDRQARWALANNPE
jgi:hypothetical protein